MNDFSDVWLSAFLDQRDTEATQREAEFVAASLRPSSTVLDIPCGFGRHSAILAHNETTTLRGDRVNVHLAYRGGRAIDQFEWQVFTPQELQDMAAAVGWALFTVHRLRWSSR